MNIDFVKLIVDPDFNLTCVKKIIALVDKRLKLKTIY